MENIDGRPVYTMQDLAKQDAIAYSAFLTGSTTIVPTAGKRIKMLKSQVLQSPDNETAVKVTLSFASIGAFVRGWVFSDSNEWLGAVDEVLTITLAGSGEVSANIRYKEL